MVIGQKKRIEELEREVQSLRAECDKQVRHSALWTCSIEFALSDSGSERVRPSTKRGWVSF